MAFRRIVGGGWPLILLAALTGAAAALVHRPAPGPAIPFPGGTAAGRTALPAPGAAAPAIGPDTRVVYRTTYRPCGTTEERGGVAPPVLIGLDAGDLGRLYPQWQVAAFTPDQVVLARETGELCTEYREWRHLRLVDGIVVVFYGRRGSDLVKERTAITAEMLPPADRLRLLSGIDLPGDSAVRAFLERGP